MSSHPKCKCGAETQGDGYTDSSGRRWCIPCHDLALLIAGAADGIFNCASVPEESELALLRKLVRGLQWSEIEHHLREIEKA